MHRLPLRWVHHKQGWWTREAIEVSFHVELSKDIQILFSWEQDEDYYAQSFFLLWDMREGKLLQVNASHCSCYGYEEQWEPDEATIGELRKRQFYDDELTQKTLGRVLDRLEKVLAAQAA